MKIKVHFTLDANHKLILQVLYGSQEMLWIDLCRIVTMIRLTEKNFSQVVKEVAEHRDLAALFFPERAERDLLEKNLRELDTLGLVKLTLNENQYPIVKWIGFTDEGRRISKAIKNKCKIILRPPASFQKTIFIASAYGYPDVDDLYQTCLEQACKSLRFDPIRVDLTEPSASITNAIIEGITEAACLLADLTYARPSVYFEVGYAQGLGLPLVLTCRSDHLQGTYDNARVHFDLEQYKISSWLRKGKGKFQWKPKENPHDRLKYVLSRLRQY